MPRRKHRKSRGGCLECKRRHIKCDERHPICSQCTISDRLCEYLQVPVGTKRTVPERRSLSRTPASSTVQDSPSDQTPGDGSAAFLEEPPVNILHTELFCHLITDTLPSLLEDEKFSANAQIMKSSSTSPFLMNELLALAATHISIQRPSERSIYRHHATQLQNHALASFNNAQNSEEPEGYMCRFIFSSMLGVHMLCDTLHFRDPDFTLFLDSFTHYLRIHCGVRSVMRNKWQALNETALGPVLRDGELRLQSKTNDGLGPECSRLLGLVERSNLGPSITATYHTAIESLQMAFNSVSSTDSPRGYCVGVVSWPATLSSEYIDLLTRRSPDALAILAHYAVILHHHRNLWLFGDGGRYLIQSISEFLGPGWAEWVAFPNHALSEPTTPMSHLT